VLCIDINNGGVLGRKYVTSLCPEVNSTLRNEVMFDIFLVVIYVALVTM